VKSEVWCLGAKDALFQIRRAVHSIAAEDSTPSMHVFVTDDMS
jgi:hypothetical protein